MFTSSSFLNLYAGKNQSNMNERDFSTQYIVRKLLPADCSAIFALCSRNELFYQYHPPFVTMESILADLSALPPGKTNADKYYIGYFQGDLLIAVMDLILHYPENNVAFIGFFMTNRAVQNQGVGSMIVNDCAQLLSANDFCKIRLAIDKGNPQSEAFWIKNHFAKTGEECLRGAFTYLPMERALSPFRRV